MKLIKLSAIASTNSYLKELHSKIPLDDETLVWANSQTGGRGQRGASWHSEAGKSLTFSLLKRFSGLRATDAVLINLAVSLGVANALDSLKIPAVMVKWPNDIMSANRKIAGILIENQLRGDTIDSSVIGIGVNVNNEQFEGLPNAGSMMLSAGKTYDLQRVLETIVDSVSTELKDIASSTFEEFQSQYESRLFRRGISSEFKKADGTFVNGCIRGVSRSGDLKVDLENGTSEVFRLKEIELIF